MRNCRLRRIKLYSSLTIARQLHIKALQRAAIIALGQHEVAFITADLSEVGDYECEARDSTNAVGRGDVDVTARVNGKMANKTTTNRSIIR